VTPDKDYGQLVDEKVKIYKPGYQGGDAEIIGVKEVCEKWNIKDVSQVIDILGLMGDAVDNIPGIPGVGEKTAAKLLAEYDTLENVLANADKIKGALGEKVRKGADSAILSKKLATIICNVPVEFHEEDFRLKEWNKEALKEVFIELEFKTVAKRLLGEEINIGTAPEGVQTDLFGNAVQSKTPAKSFAAKTPDNQDAVEEITTEGDAPQGLPAGKNISNTPHRYELIQGSAISAFVADLLAQKEICFDTETTSVDAVDAEIVGMSFAYRKGEAYYVPFPADQQDALTMVNEFKELFENESIMKIGQNIKYDLMILQNYGIEVRGKMYDTMLAHYL
ncbi:MAG: DNA polymerase I, partial [Chitinophagaceae bacterium]